jgi:hypothetical protein
MGAAARVQGERPRWDAGRQGSPWIAHPVAPAVPRDHDHI